MNKQDLTKIVYHCEKEDCHGQPIVDNGSLVYRPHRLRFDRFDRQNQAHYICPGCGDEEVFELKPNGEGFQKVQPGCVVIIGMLGALTAAPWVLTWLLQNVA